MNTWVAHPRNRHMATEICLLCIQMCLCGWSGTQLSVSQPECVYVCVNVCAHDPGLQLVKSLVVSVFRSQSLVEAVTLLIGSGRSDPLGSAPHPARPCPCLVGPPQWGPLLHPHSTHTPEHTDTQNLNNYPCYTGQCRLERMTDILGWQPIPKPILNTIFLTWKTIKKF